MDKKLRNQTIYDYYDYIERVKEEDLTNCWWSECKYRADNQLNVLTEIYGSQGSGKSLFGSALNIGIANIFGVPFDFAKNISIDFDELDSIIRSAPFRSTFQVDEQPTTFIGYGSNTTKNSLKDFEEMARFTQKNITYIAPTEREHASYFVFKEDEKSSVERTKNDKCLACNMQGECIGTFPKHKFTTLCGMPFWERHGYPIKFRFLLLTHRKTDNFLMPRGYISLPVLTPEKMLEYEEIKKRSIVQMESKDSFAWEHQRQELEDFVSQYFDKLVIEKKNGKQVQSLNLIKAYLMDAFGKRHYTTSEMDIISSLVKADLQEKINEN